MLHSAAPYKYISNNNHRFTAIIQVNLLWIQFNVQCTMHRQNPPALNWRILSVQSFTACMPLLTATSAFGSGSRCWRSPQQCYLHCLNSIQMSLYTELDPQHCVAATSVYTAVRNFTLLFTRGVLPRGYQCRFLASCLECREQDYSLDRWSIQPTADISIIKINISTNVSAKTDRTFISTILPGHYFMTVSVIRQSGPCSFLLRPP